MQKNEKCREQQKEIEQFIEKGFAGKERIIIYGKFLENTTYKEISFHIGYLASHTRKLLRKVIYKYLAG